MIRCGTSELVITPALGLMIPGQFNVKLAEGIKDDLYAKAVVFDDGKNIIALVALDIIGVTSEMTFAVRKRVNEVTGIPQKNIMMSATHTHTGAPTGFQLYSSLPDAETVINICQKAADAVIIAYSRMKDAAVGYGMTEECDVGYNRRFIMKNGKAATNPGFGNPEIVKPAAPVDASVNVLRIDGDDGKPFAVVVNYACHLDVVGGYEYSADYPGEMSKIIKKALGSDVVVIFFNGCCGDINHLNFLGDPPANAEHYKKMGRILAGDVISVMEKIKTSSDIEIACADKTVMGMRRQPTAEQVEWSKKILSDPNSGEMDRVYAEAYSDLFANPILNADIEVQAFKIGDVGVAAFPSETFTEIGLDIKSGSPFKHTLTVELANNCVGYVSTAKALEEGGYETNLSKYTYMDSSTAELISMVSVELLKTLYPCNL